MNGIKFQVRTEYNASVNVLYYGAYREILDRDMRERERGE